MTPDIGSRRRKPLEVATKRNIPQLGIGLARASAPYLRNIHIC
jgi:hypothetical protein